MAKKNIVDEGTIKDAIENLVLTEDTSKKIDVYSDKIIGHFNGQNNPLIRALTLQVNKDTKQIVINVYDPKASLLTAVSGTGMKTAFTEKPVREISLEEGSHVDIEDANGKRIPGFSAGLELGGALSSQMGINSFSPLSKLLEKDESIRTMKFMLGCDEDTSDNQYITTYNAIYELIFKAAPVYLVERTVKINTDTELQLTPVCEFENCELEWSSNNSNVTVDAAGKIKGVNQGEAIISVNVKGSDALPAQVKVIVNAPVVATEEPKTNDDATSEETVPSEETTQPEVETTQPEETTQPTEENETIE